MNQQRSRRFRSAQEAAEKEQDAADFIQLLEKQKGKKFDDSLKSKKVWDSNAITPGTPFMDILALSLRYWTAYKLNTDPAWAKLKVIISDSTVPGEGEHKIMEFVRSQRANPEHDPNTRHVIYGLDADLIMLGLGTHEPHFRVLREDVFAADAKAKTCKICGQTGHRAENCSGKAKVKNGEFDEKAATVSKKPFIWLHVSILREYLAVELDVKNQGFKFDLERAIDDWVFMCFFVGNDFLPHLPSLEIRDGGIDTLITIWKENLPAMGGYLTKDGTVELERVQYVLDGLAQQEDAIFRRRRQAEERREANAKRRKMNEQGQDFNTGRSNINETPGYENTIMSAPSNRKKGPPDSAPPPMIPLMKPGDLSKETKKLNYDMVMNREGIRKANLQNKSAAQALKSQLLSGTLETAAETPINGAETEESTPSESVAEPEPVVPHKRKAAEFESEPATPKPKDDEMPPDTVRLWEPGYRDRYYEQKFHVDPKDIEFRKKVAAHYVEGLCWVLMYYFQGCPSWNWYYPYHYAPFAQDFKDVGKMVIEFNKGKPFKPFEQLMGVLPAASKHNLPEPFQKLMTDADSEIIDFYPENFPIDLNGKKFAWQGVALLPFIDEKRLLDAAQKVYPKLAPEDSARNAMGHDTLLISDGHPLYDDVAKRFYSKKQDVKVSGPLSSPITLADRVEIQNEHENFGGTGWSR
jgi:5'-3' exoribonuclease 2